MRWGQAPLEEKRRGRPSFFTLPTAVRGSFLRTTFIPTAKGRGQTAISTYSAMAEFLSFKPSSESIPSSILFEDE